MIAEDTLEAYEAYAAVFPQSPYTVRVRLLADRRKEMIAWNIAVIVNTVASFRSFVVRYPGSDLAATARKLEDRIRNRSLNANAAVIPTPVQTAAAAPAGAPNATPIPASLPTNVATAPNMCPCTIQPPPPVKKKADTKPPVKRADIPPPTRQPTPPPRRVRPPTDDDIARGGPPADVVVPAIIGGAIIGGGIAGGMSRRLGRISRPPAVDIGRRRRAGMMHYR